MIRFVLACVLRLLKFDFICDGMHHASPATIRSKRGDVKEFTTTCVSCRSTIIGSTRSINITAMQVDLKDANINDTAVHAAAAAVSDTMMRALMQALPDDEARRAILSQPNNRGLMPLHCLLEPNDFADRPKPPTYLPTFEALARALLDYHKELGVSVDQHSPRDGATPLLLACREDAKLLPSLLLKAGADVNAGSSRNETPLMAAVSNGNDDMVERLIEAGADVKQATAWSLETALHYAIAERSSLRTVRALVKAGADVNAVDETDKSPVALAAEYAQGDVVRCPQAAL